MAEKPTYEKLQQIVNSLRQENAGLKQAAENLRESADKYRSFFINMYDIFYHTDADGIVTLISPSVEKITGYSPDEIIGRKMKDYYVVPQENQRLGELLSRDGYVQNFEAQIKCKDNSDIWISSNSNLIIDGQGNAVGVEGIMRDITEHKQVQEALKFERQRFFTTLEKIPAFVCLQSQDYKYRYANATFRKLFGDHVNRYCYKAFHGSDKPCEVCPTFEVFQTKETKIREWKRNSDEIYMIYDNYLHDIDGSPLVLEMGIDITRHKRAEEEKRKALEFAAEQSKLSLIGQVAGKMAHDFNNVLMGIMGNAQLALMDCTDSQLNEKLEHIVEYAERGRDITSNLISYSKDQEPKQIFFKIEDKIELVLKMLEKELKGITISRNYKPGVPGLLADPGMIQDVLTNLLQNAIHAMSLVEHPALQLKTYSKNGKVYFEIEDNGCGIPKEHQDSIFTPSFTLKGSHDKIGSYKLGITGTGYGMSNVKKYIVEKHKGDIFLESEAGKGTKITIAFNVIKNHLSKDEKKVVGQNKIYKKRKILLVEDESAIAEVQYQILSKEPFRHIVSTAVNGQMAIDVFDRTEFDAVSLDYMLPGKINGLDVYRHIRKKSNDIPVLFISGNIAFLESMQQLQEKDPNLAYLSKPVNNLDYVNQINELIAGDT